MTEQADQNLRHQERMEIITKIYDAVANPQKSNEFVAAWERFISDVSEPMNDRRNASGPSDVLIEDNDMEMHFARAYTLLERLGREHPLETQNKKRDETGLVVRFGSDGRVLNQPEHSAELYGKFSSGLDLGRLLDTDAQESWKIFIQTVARAPTIDELHVFAGKEGGNFVAYNRRDETSGEVHTLVKDLNVSWTPALEALLLQKFGLTNGELKLVRDLCAFGSLDLVSKHSARSKNTLRTQLRSVFQKLNVKSQVDVVQTASMLAHLSSYVGFADVPLNPLPHWGKEIRVKLPRDVSVPVHLIGPEEGRPLLTLHGMLDGVAVSASVVEALHKHNLRIVAPIRPNFGSSDSNLDIANTVQITVDQLEHVANALSLDRFFVLGHMSGSLFAFAAAQRLGSRVQGIINISGGVPILTTRQFSKMSHRQKAFAYTTRFAPAMLPALLRLGVAQVDSADLMGLVHDMYRVDSPDRAALEDPGIAATVLDGYRFAVRQGSKGFEADAYQVTRNWTDLLPQKGTPGLLIHGFHDPVVAIDTVRDFADREAYELMEFADEGQLVLYTQADVVMRKISAFMNGQK